ncbi:hypothetical protein [Porticoccus sp.]
MKVQADTNNGVYRVEDFDGEVLSQQDFYEALDGLCEGEFICAEIDEATAAKIDAEYGIH